MPDIEEIALAFDTSCREADVPYAFVGGIAVLAWGQPRATMAVDALVDVQATRAVPFRESLGRRGLVLNLKDLEDARREGTHVTVLAKNSAFHADVKLARTPMELEELKAAIEVPFGAQRLRVARPEDVIAFKLFFGGPQDLADARSILVRNERKIERKELRATCVRLGVGAKLQAMMDEIARAGK